MTDTAQEPSCGPRPGIRLHDVAPRSVAAPPTLGARFERDQRRANLAWMIGIVAVMVFTAAFWPSIEGTNSFDDVIEDLPANLQSLIGASDGISLGTPAGYFNARVSPPCSRCS